MAKKKNICGLCKESNRSNRCTSVSMDYDAGDGVEVLRVCVGESNGAQKVRSGDGDTACGVDGLRIPVQEAKIHFSTRGMLTKRSTGRHRYKRDQKDGRERIWTHDRRSR